MTSFNKPVEDNIIDLAAWVPEKPLTAVSELPTHLQEGFNEHWCPTCDGTGYVDGDYEEECPDCMGTGIDSEELSSEEIE